MRWSSFTRPPHYWGSGDHDFKDVEIEIKIVTPQHIASAIQEALKVGWENMPYKEQLIIKYENGKYLMG